MELMLDCAPGLLPSVDKSILGDFDRKSPLSLKLSFVDIKFAGSDCRCSFEVVL